MAKASFEDTLVTIVVSSVSIVVATVVSTIVLQKINQPKITVVPSPSPVPTPPSTIVTAGG